MTHRTSRLALALATLAVFAVAGCGSDDSSGTTAPVGGGGGAGGAVVVTGGGAGGSGTSGAAAPLSCSDIDDSDTCTYFSAAEPGRRFFSPPGVIVPVCPTTDLIATCTFTAGGVDQEYFYYKGQADSMSTLKSGCDSLSGTFTATPS